MNELFVWPIRVYYEDTDAGGVVYHSNYLQFMERARTEWLRTMGFNQEQLHRERKLLFAVTNMEIRFQSPARLDDSLNVSVTMSSLKRASFILHQTIQRTHHSTSNNPQTLIQASVRIALLNNHFKPTRLPPDLLKQLNKRSTLALEG